MKSSMHGNFLHISETIGQHIAVGRMLGMYRLEFPDMMVFERSKERQTIGETPSYVSEKHELIGKGTVMNMESVPHANYKKSSMDDLLWTFLLRNIEAFADIEIIRRGQMKRLDMDLRAFINTWKPIAGTITIAQAALLAYYAQNGFATNCTTYHSIKIGNTDFVAQPNINSKNISHSGVRFQYSDSDRIYFGVIRAIVEVAVYNCTAQTILVVDSWKKPGARSKTGADVYLPHVVLQYEDTHCLWPGAIDPYKYMFLPCQKIEDPEQTGNYFYAFTTDAHTAAL